MFNMFRGFQVFIGDATEFAVMTDRSYIMDTGRYINMDISGGWYADALLHANVSGFFFSLD